MTIIDKKSKLTQSQELVINSLLTGSKVVDACRDGKVTRQAYYLWLKDDQYFQDELERRRNEVVESSMERLRGLMDKSVSKLAELVDNENPEVARKSAGQILEYSLKWSENKDIEGQLESLEKLVLEKRTFNRS